MSWYQIGTVYEDTEQPEAAEAAYRNSLEIAVLLGDVAGQGRTLMQIGNLYGEVLDRPEDAVSFCRQAAEKFVKVGDQVNEGIARTNLANGLTKLSRFDEARWEIRQAIKCGARFGHASQPWKTWAVLVDIEAGAGRSSAAAEAKSNASACYLAYRRAGGENYEPVGRISFIVTQALVTGERASIETELQQHATEIKALPFIHALQAIVAGSRDRTLADAPDLNYSMAAEIIILIETLEKNSL